MFRLFFPFRLYIFYWFCLLPNLLFSDGVFYIVRHGETDANIGKNSKYRNLAINHIGQEQCLKLADQLQHMTFFVCYASDLRRTRESAEILTDRLNVPLYFDKRLREKQHLRVRDGVLRRFLQFLEEKRSLHPAENILIVTHSSLMKALVVHLLGHSKKALQINNAGFCSLEHRNGKWKIIDRQGIQVL